MEATFHNYDHAKRMFVGLGLPNWPRGQEVITSHVPKQ